ncbi:TonB-dependent receptor [Chishuiella changwenlii]|nr:TonB-dependent receptor [Chishuiella changwenlii]GGE94477.1 TonB-dependent receptor [Chishuiella changwenlii]
MKLNSKKLLFIGVFALAGSLSFAQVVEPTDSTKVEQANDENVSLTETLIIGKGIIDVAEDRKTPVAVSTINRATLEDKAIGNVDFPEIFTTTPSVYVSSQSSGFGDSDMFLRGFSSENTAYLLNGQPVNGMEDGKLYWSNWSAMTEVAENVQIQRGLGSSKLAISSVGGTVNMITKATQKKQGGYLRYNVGNDSYMSTTIAYNTGMKSKWGASFLFNHWQGHRAFAQGTSGEGQAYFVSVGYKPNERHQLNFMIFGAPQQHGQNFATKRASDWATAEEMGYGRKYNTTYGYFNGRGENLRTNYYHKPVANLNWDWTINENANLSTVLYASTGTGGGSFGIGNAMNTRRDGLIDFNAIQNNNLLAQDGIGNVASNGAIRSSVNNHFWYGAVTNFNYDTKTGWNFNLGADLRFYKGQHFQQMTNLFGLNGWSEQRPDGQTVVVNKAFSTNPWSALFNSANRDQRVNRDNSENINYQGVFGQVEYANDIFSVFAQGAVSNQFYQKFDAWNYGGIEQASARVNKTGWNIKGGASLFINKENSIFANVGKYSRQPYLRNVIAPNSVNLRDPEVKNEEIMSYEIGYQYKTRNLKVNINAYHTEWSNRFLAVSGQVTPDPINAPDVTRPINTYYTNIGQVHKGIEVDFDAKISRVFSVYGFASYGDWKYDGNTPFESEYTDDNTFFERGNVDLTGTYVGEAAQFTFGMGTKINFAKRLYWDVDFMYNARIWGQVNPTSVVESSRRGETYQAEQIPGFARVNTGLAYEFKFGKQSIKLRGNVRNLFNEQYLNMIDRNGDGYAVGRTWNAGVTYTF